CGISPAVCYHIVICNYQLAVGNCANSRIGNSSTIVKIKVVPKQSDYIVWSSCWQTECTIICVCVIGIKSNPAIGTNNNRSISVAKKGKRKAYGNCRKP